METFVKWAARWRFMTTLPVIAIFVVFWVGRILVFRPSSYGAGISFNESSRITLLDGLKAVRLENVCLEATRASTGDVSLSLLIWKKIPNLFHHERIPTMANVYIPISTIDDPERIQDCQFIQEEYVVIQRTVVNNFYHWMQELFLIWQLLEFSSKPYRIFHLPATRPFYNAADLSYLQLVALLDVVHQRNFSGPILDWSLRHADELLNESSSSSYYCSCFRSAVLGRSGKYAGNPLSESETRSFQRFVATFLSSVVDKKKLDARTPAACPRPRVLIQTRPPHTARSVTNLDEILERLNQLKIDYQMTDLLNMSVKKQVELAASQSTILVAPHGQGLWLVYFLPKNSSVIEILPHAFPYDAYYYVAKSRGILDYLRVSAPPVNATLPKATQNIRMHLGKELGLDPQSIERTLEMAQALLANSTHYSPVVDLLIGLGVEKSKAGVLGKVFAREQTLTPNVDQLIEAIHQRVQKAQFAGEALLEEESCCYGKGCNNKTN